jgi:hypothetical protein
VKRHNSPHQVSRKEFGADCMREEGMSREWEDCLRQLLSGGGSFSPGQFTSSHFEKKCASSSAKSGVQ